MFRVIFSSAFTGCEKTRLGFQVKNQQRMGKGSDTSKTPELVSGVTPIRGGDTSDTYLDEPSIIGCQKALLTLLTPPAQPKEEKVNKTEYTYQENRKPIPEAVRQAVLDRAKRCCENCGQHLPLEMHHTTYKIIFGNEDPSVLLALCRQCHFLAHVDICGHFWSDPEEKESYWATYGK
jgi:hypothetical protein